MLFGAKRNESPIDSKSVVKIQKIVRGWLQRSKARKEYELLVSKLVMEELSQKPQESKEFKAAKYIQAYYRIHLKVKRIREYLAHLEMQKQIEAEKKTNEYQLYYFLSIFSF